MPDDSKRIRELERLVDKQAEQIDRMRNARRPAMPRGRALSARGSFVRVIIPDSHGCYVDKPAVAAMLGDIAALAPREIVWLGDHLDCGGFLAQHHTTHYVAQAEYTFEDDCEHANDLIDRVQLAAPKAAHHYLEGNHERRIETWICTQTLRNATDAGYLRRMLSPESVLSLAKRRIAFYGLAAHHMGLCVRGAIKLGHCYFVHGISTAKHAAAATLAKFGAPVVFGHTHRAEVYTSELVNTAVGVIAAWCPGCLCERAPMYLHGNPGGWTAGYAVQLVARDGTFLHLQIPIVDGVSYLKTFMGIAKR